MNPEEICDQVEAQQNLVYKKNVGFGYIGNGGGGGGRRRFTGINRIVFVCNYIDQNVISSK